MSLKSFVRKLGNLSPVQKAIRGHGTVGKLIDRSMSTAEAAGPWIAAAAASIYTGNTAPLQLAAAGNQYTKQKQQAQAFEDALNNQPGVPTIDTAAQSQQALDRIRRRRGVFANIFAGGSAGAPSVGRATLGG